MKRHDISIQNEYTVPVEYSFIFTAKPFGVCFKNRDASGSITNTKLFVSKVADDCAAYGHIIVGSQLIKVQDESVIGLKGADVIRRITVKHAKLLPLMMTFRKPMTRRVSSTKDTALKKGMKTDCNPRSLFLGIGGFYKLWRTLSSEILIDALVICTSDEYQQLVKRKRSSSRKRGNRMKKDAVFRNLLQWKDKQGLLLIVNRSTFWQNLSDKLVTLMDPSIYKTLPYSALKIRMDGYQKVDTFKYDVTAKDIERELTAATLNVDVVQEILYRSKVLLDIYDENGVHMNPDKQMASSFDEQFDSILDEIVCVWDKNDNGNFID